MRISDWSSDVCSSDLIEDKLKMEIDPQVEAASGKQSTAAKLVVRLKDGREITAFVSAPKGSQSRSFTRDEHHSRFKQELMTRISGSACAEIIAAASDLEQDRKSTRLNSSH